MNPIRSLLLRAAGALSRPRRGEGLLYYSQTDRALHLVDDAGTDTALGAGGGGSGAPTTADYLVKTADAGLSAERVVTNTSWISVDWATAGQAKFNLDDAGLVSLASADAAAGLPYVSAANTWTSLALAADKGVYATSTTALATFDLTSFARTLLDDANAAAARTTLGLVIGTDVQAYDAGLASLTAADASAGLPYVSAANTWTALTLEADKLIASSSSSAMTTESYGTVRAASKIPKSSAEASLWGWAHPHPTREVWGMFSARNAGFDAYAQTSANSITTQSNQSDSDGVFRGCATGAVSGNGITLELTLGAGVYAKKGTRASLIFRTDPTLFTSSCRLWIGWCSTNPGDATTISGGDAIMLRAHSNDGDTQFTPYSRDNTTTTAGSAFGPTLANDTIYRIDFEWTSSTSCTITIVDVDAGTTASSTITTTLPRTGQPMDFVVQMYTKSNNVRRLDWGALVQAMGWGQSPYLG